MLASPVRLAASSSSFPVGIVPPGGTEIITFPITPNSVACSKVKAKADQPKDCDGLRRVILGKRQQRAYLSEKLAKQKTICDEICLQPPPDDPRDGACFNAMHRMRKYCFPPDLDPAQCAQARADATLYCSCDMCNAVKELTRGEYRKVELSLRSACQAYRAKDCPDADALCGDVDPVTAPLTAPDPEASITICPVTSWDPNDKIGLPGHGQQQYVSSSVPLVYTVRFENLSTASAAAQEVMIQDTLDPSFDAATFEFLGIRFGTSVVDLSGQGLDEWTTVVDLRPEKNLVVQISGKFERSTGQATWRFRSLDPDTGEIPGDPLAGFLPANKVPPEGEGSVAFAVRAKTGIATNTAIHNGASIVFDANPPIETTKWTNFVDNTKPDSRVVSIPSLVHSTSFKVAWTGSDIGSGVRDYALYVSENGAPAVPLVSATRSTSIVFSGSPGKVYSFFSLAQDQAGNV